MSLIKDTTAGGSIVDLTLENSLQKLGIECYNNAVITDAMLSNVTVSINRVTKGGGSVPIIYPMSLQYLLEISACSEGAYRSTLVTGLVVIGTIDISNFGTLQLGQDEYMQLSVTHTNGVNFGVRVYALEGQEYTSSSIMYQLNSVLADTPKLINVSDCYLAALPVTNLTKVILQYSDGRTATYTAIELQMICNDVNDMVHELANAGGTAFQPVYGYNNLFCIAIEEVINMTVHYSASSKFFTLKNI